MNPSDNKTGKTPKPTPNLERTRVVTVALELLNEVGYEGLTLRRLADKLGVKAAALYWHFENKQDLIDQLAVRIISDESQDGSRTHKDYENLTWQELLQAMGMGMRKGLMRYRDGAQVLANADLSKARNLEGRHVLYERLLDHGFTLEQIIGALFTIGRYTLGCVFEEQADPRSKTQTKQDYQRYRNEAFKDHPRILNEFSKLDASKIMDAETNYKRGLEFIITGIGATIGKQN